MKRVAIIGAGPAGLTAAYELTKAGIGVDVYEACGQVGGMCRTLDLWGQKVDLGPHRFFSGDKRVNSLWLEVVGRDYEMVPRLTRIHYSGSFFKYPLKAFDALSKLGVGEACRCLMSYVTGRLRGATAKEAESFEEWVVSRFGRRLFEIFFKSYSEKLWGIGCDELDADFAAQRIKKFSLGEAIRSAVFPSAKQRHKTLVDEFAYPHGGTGMVYERMADFIRANGGTIQLNAPVQCVTMQEQRITGLELQSGETHEYDHVVSTMPLTHLMATIGAPANLANTASKLRFRNTILVYLRVPAEDLFPDNWLYVHSPELKMGRITNFSNWVPQTVQGSKDTILAVEYWCYDDDDIWTASPEQIIRTASDELSATGLIGAHKVDAGKVIRIPRCYPVYSKGYRQLLEPLEEYLTSIDCLSVIGRYGAFKYNNQDHSILMGILAAENIAEGKSHNLWEINTDYEAYQEESTITRTGLQVSASESGVWRPELASA